MFQPLSACLILVVYFNYSYAEYQENLALRGLGLRFGVLDNSISGRSRSAGNQHRVENQWFEQRLDHFDAQNTQKWMQRYFSRHLYFIQNWQNWILNSMFPHFGMHSL